MRHQTPLRRWVLRGLAAGLSLAATLAVVAILTRSFDDTEMRLIVTSVGFSLLSVVGGAGLGAQRRSGTIRGLGGATAIGAVVSFALLLVGLWDDRAGVGLWRAFAILALVTLAAAHACLVLTSRRASDSPLIVAMASASIFAASLDALLGALAIGGAVERVEDDFVRLIAVLVIAMLLTSVLPPILRRLARDDPAHPTGLPAPLPSASIVPAERHAGELLAVAGRLEQLAPAAGGLAATIAHEAARLRELAQDPPP